MEAAPALYQLSRALRAQPGRRKDERPFFFAPSSSNKPGARTARTSRVCRTAMPVWHTRY